MTRMPRARVVWIAAQPRRVRAVLSDLEEVPRWDEDVLTVTPLDRGVAAFSRRGPAFNLSETVALIRQADGALDYRVHGALDYLIRWRTRWEKGMTRLSAVLAVQERAAEDQLAGLFEEVLEAPFNQKLVALKRLCERGR